MTNSENIAVELNRLWTTLDQGQQLLLLDIAKFMTRPIESYVNPESDILSPRFVANFSNRLLIHHATHEEKFKKKSFEYAFHAASQAEERKSQIVASQVNPGADVIANGVAFSLKTEAAKGIQPQKIFISKLMEARWIRECAVGADFYRGIQEKVVPHLEQYQRIVTLRAFDLPGQRVKYDFVEIPRDVLLAVRTLRPESFSPRTKNGGSRAAVSFNGRQAFSLNLDGSVEKIQVTGLDVSVCVLHGSWTMPTISTVVPDGESEDEG